MASNATSSDVVLGLGVELLMLGIATGVAGVSDETGTMMVVFMLGLLLVWLIYHQTATRALPNLMKYLQGRGVLLS
jgi:hypothetical protein